MTVNTQELRELLEKATPGPWFHGAKNGEHKYCVYDKVCWTDDDGRHGETPNMVVHVSPDDGKYHDAAYIAAANPATVSALLDEIDALRAELQARQWQPIESAPHDQEVLLGWYEWDGEWKTEVGAASWGWRTDRVSNISKHGRATHWQSPPPAPPQGDRAC